MGYDDSSSVCIEKVTNVPEAWYGWFYGYPFEWEHIVPSVRYRLSAMVKTENCVGKVRLRALKIVNGPGWLYSNLYSDDSWQIEAENSRELRGTNDWVELDVLFNSKDWSPTYITLEMSGAGKCWFDNVRITKAADLNKDGKTNMGDMAILGRDWRKNTDPQNPD